MGLSHGGQRHWAAVVSRQLGTGFFDHWCLGFSDTGQYRWFVNTTSGYSSTTLGGRGAGRAVGARGGDV